MKWHIALGTQAARRCCFCEYWIGPMPEPMVKARGGMFEYDDKISGICRHPSYLSKQTCSGGRCVKFVLNPHIH